MNQESDSVTGSAASDPVTESSTTGTAVPLFMVSAYQDQQQRQKNDTLPKLPSHRFRFSVWHDVANISATGDKLRAPRVRDGPQAKEELFYKLRDENNKRIHHNLLGSERKNYQNTQENWENAVHVNLAYQELNHEYQRKEMYSILQRLLSAVEINLFDNGLVNLKSVTFPRCEYLNLTQNYIKSFKMLPGMPHIKCLNLNQNDVRDLQGLELLVTLEHLSMKENPIAFSVGYRKRVFAALPSLKTLDGVPRLPADLEPPPPPEKQSNNCVIS